MRWKKTHRKAIKTRIWIEQVMRYAHTNYKGAKRQIRRWCEIERERIATCDDDIPF